MPQMAPISWLTLFIMFTLVFIMFCMMNYYITLPLAPKTSDLKKSSNYHMSWKW
uniref:ATP synthase complex subunit 8 n=1 Tax=Oreogeton sp. DY-2020 TaxID=2709820 RepID=A0A6C0W4Y7_9MUSC|nr:ATP synthase F0 subunit 8 [Oreogeton sp. DY-2020]